MEYLLCGAAFLVVLALGVFIGGIQRSKEKDPKIPFKQTLEKRA